MGGKNRLKQKKENPVLTQRQKTFARCIYEGKEQHDAYVLAGYAVATQTAATIDSNASRLARSVKVKAEIDRLNKKTEDDTIADKKERQRILSEIARARLTDYVTCGPDRDLISVGPESPNTAAFQEITSRTEYDKDGAGAAVVTKLKLHNPVAAIDLLNKMDKLYQDMPPFQDNRQYNIIVADEKTKEGIQWLIAGGKRQESLLDEGGEDATEG